MWIVFSVTFSRGFNLQCHFGGFNLNMIYENVEMCPYSDFSNAYYTPYVVVKFPNLIAMTIQWHV